MTGNLFLRGGKSTHLMEETDLHVAFNQGTRRGDVGSQHGVAPKTVRLSQMVVAETLCNIDVAELRSLLARCTENPPLAVFPIDKWDEAKKTCLRR